MGLQTPSWKPQVVPGACRHKLGVILEAPVGCLARWVLSRQASPACIEAKSVPLERHCSPLGGRFPLVIPRNQGFLPLSYYCRVCVLIFGAVTGSSTLGIIGYKRWFVHARHLMCSVALC